MTESAKKINKVFEDNEKSCERLKEVLKDKELKVDLRLVDHR